MPRHAGAGIVPSHARDVSSAASHTITKHAAVLRIAINIPGMKKGPKNHFASSEMSSDPSSRRLWLFFYFPMTFQEVSVTLRTPCRFANCPERQITLAPLLMLRHRMSDLPSPL